MLLLRGAKIPAWPWPVYPALGLMAIALHWWSVPLPASLIVGVGLLALLVNVLEQAPQMIKSILSCYPLRQFGLWSFSIYLWQQPFYLAQHRDNLPNWQACGMAISAGIASYYLLEKPLRRYLNSRWAKEPPSGINAAPAS